MKQNTLKFILSAFVGALLFCACGTPEVTAYKITGTVTTAVDGAMQAWGDYVRAGLATSGDEIKVKAAFIKYKASERVVADAVTAYKLTQDETAFKVANAALRSSAADLIDLVRMFLPPPQASKVKGIK